MGLQRPRRIFRGSAYAEPGAAFGLVVRGTVIIGLAAAAVGGTMVLLPRPASVFGNPPALSGTVSAEASLVAVVDGGTLRLRDTVVRLAGLAAPERGRSCPDGLGGSYDCGAAAAEALAGLVRGRSVSCRLAGYDELGLAQGACEAAGADLGETIVAAGWACVHPDAARPAGAPGSIAADGTGLAAMEVEARARQRGLWRNGASPIF